MLILASNSPRRRELLETAGYEFRVVPSDVDEDIFGLDDPARYTMQLALMKARDVKKNLPGDVVVGSDTVVEIDGNILGKPINDEDAAAMLGMLSGRVHRVTTGVAICTDGGDEVFSRTAEVEFYPLSPQEIEDYIATNEPRDKAGAYGIQGRGMLLIKGIDGDYYTIMGLPVAELSRRLKKHGISPTK